MPRATSPRSAINALGSSSTTSRRARIGATSSALCLALIGTIALTSCADTQPGDTSCHRFKRIAADDRQREAFKNDKPLWEPLVNQLVAHNRSYDAVCK